MIHRSGRILAVISKARRAVTYNARRATVYCFAGVPVSAYLYARSAASTARAIQAAESHLQTAAYWGALAAFSAQSLGLDFIAARHATRAAHAYHAAAAILENV